MDNNQAHSALFTHPVRILAPMEGLTDPVMRQVLTHIGNYSWCVTEFIRVTNTCLPAHVFYKYAPELKTHAKTSSGTPIHIQLLGSNAEIMAENAVVAASLGAPAIDLNFGCPAKTVNKHRGGAVLLDEPETIYHIVLAVRQAVPAHLPVSAKIRLGYADSSKSLDIAHAIEQAGASWLTVHARTKTQGYTPPAYWHLIAPISQMLDIPVIANGEIWSLQNAQQCMAQANTPHLMLGRGAVITPDLVNLIDNPQQQPLTWAQLLPYQVAFLHGQAKNDVVLVGRYKQWLGMLSKGYAEANKLWQQVKKVKDKQAIIELLWSAHY